MVDYTSLRNSSSIDTETVSVNHRALITRTLTKYPVDYALYRELLQNSADAGAQSVVISYQMDASDEPLIKNLHTVASIPVKKLTVKNNGALFQEADWNRLKEIAKGNPDESKIGAFGVGFYSVFELADEPLVHSGSDVMNFFYSGDQLHYKRQKTETSNGWTIIDLPYRNAGTIPNLPQFTAFLTQSFMLVPLNNIKVMANDVVLFELSRTPSPAKTLTIPRSINRKSYNSTLSLDSMSIEPQQVIIDYLNVTQISETKSTLMNFSKKWFSSLVPSSSDPTEKTHIVCFLRKVTAVVSVSVSRSFSKQMKETVLKPPPAKAILSMLTFNRNERDLSIMNTPLERYIYPEDVSDAKIFIGFPTKQSPGIKSHLALNQAIPTMERTAVDMSNGLVKDWNASVLYMAGIVARVVYEHEMDEIKQSIPNNKSEDLCNAVSYIMSRFYSEKSTPDARPGEYIANGFWQCSRELAVLSQHGIFSSNQVKYAGDAVFLKNLHVVSKELSSDAMKFINLALDFNILQRISAKDVIQELESRSLTSEELPQLFLWGSTQPRDDFLRCIKSTVVGNTTLSQVKYIQNIFTIEADLPLPSTCLPYDVVKSLPSGEISRLGWTELQVVPDWLEFVIKTPPSEEENVALNPAFAIKVLKKIADTALSNEQKVFAYRLLAETDCIPTISHGMKPPGSVYLSKMDLFPDLPVVSSQVSVSQKFLSDLGVRKSVSMEFVMKLLQGADNNLKWTSKDVVKYILANEKHLKKNDWKILANTAFFKSSNLSGDFRASELYPPYPELKHLHFGVISWKNWVDDSSESRLLHRIGLKQYPPLYDVLMNGSNSKELAAKSRDFFLFGFNRGWYKSSESYAIDAKIIPAVLDDKHILESASKCWINKNVRLFKLPFVGDIMRGEGLKFGIRENPPINLLIDCLIRNPPVNLDISDQMFSYLGTRVGDLTKSDISKCVEARIIRLGNRQLVRPKEAFLKSSYQSEDSEISSDLSILRDLFGFIEVSAGAELFLRKIGMRSNPNLIERSWALIDNPLSVHLRSKKVSDNAYLDMLIHMSRELDVLKRNSALISKMKTSRFLLAEKYNEQADVKERILTSVSDSNVVISDDVILYNFFKTHIMTCPPIEDLETFYQYLGCQRLSNIVNQTYSWTGEYEDKEKQIELETRIIERIGLFISGISKDKLKAKKFDNIRVVLVKNLSTSLKLISSSFKNHTVTQDIGAVYNSETGILHVCMKNFDWFDISQSIIKSILKRPGPDASIVLETLFSSDIKGLERKGYNVGRLLQKQEDEKRRALEKQREEERQMRQKDLQQKEKKEALADAVRGRANGQSIDGSCDLIDLKSNENNTSMVSAQQSLIDNMKSLTNNVGKDLMNGQNRVGATSNPASNSSNPASNPPQPSAPDVSSTNRLIKPWKSFFKREEGSSNRSNTPSTTTISSNEQPVNSSGNFPEKTLSSQPADNKSVQNILTSGIKASKAYNKSSLTATINHGQIQKAIAKYSSDCSGVEIQHLKLYQTLNNESRTKCFISKDLTSLNENQIKEAMRFSLVLNDCSQVFGNSPDICNIYFDANSKAVAFNNNNRLFFNLKYFLSPMHGDSRPLNGDGVGTGVWNIQESLDYWYPVFAHELAHNLVSGHGSDHSFICESYIQFYMERFQRIRENAGRKS